MAVGIGRLGPSGKVGRWGERPGQFELGEVRGSGRRWLQMRRRTSSRRSHGTWAWRLSRRGDASSLESGRREGERDRVRGEGVECVAGNGRRGSGAGGGRGSSKTCKSSGNCRRKERKKGRALVAAKGWAQQQTARGKIHPARCPQRGHFHFSCRRRSSSSSLHLDELQDCGFAAKGALRDRFLRPLPRRSRVPRPSALGRAVPSAMRGVQPDLDRATTEEPSSREAEDRDRCVRDHPAMNGPRGGGELTMRNALVGLAAFQMNGHSI